MNVIATTFRAAVVREPGGAPSIELIDLPVREPGTGEVRVDVAAASVNPVDLGVAGGRFHALGLIDQPERTGLGWDFAGVVAATGPDVTLPVGTRVAGLVPGFDRDFGTYAEQLVVPVRDVAVVPDALEFTAATTLPLNGLTADQIVGMLGDAPADGSRLLVTGAAGAVGATVAVLAAERGWRPTGWARAADEPFVRGLGAGFTAQPLSGWDAVVDAAALHGEALALVREGGRYISLQPAFAPAAERGITVETVNVQPDPGRLAELLVRAAAGTLPTRVHAVLPLEQAADAHRAVAAGGVRGRYVLAPSA